MVIYFMNAKSRNGARSVSVNRTWMRVRVGKIMLGGSREEMRKQNAFFHSLGKRRLSLNVVRAEVLWHNIWVF